ncbi:MAG: CoA transferase [Pseudomonadales bacterium]|nr:CoA transferase [Pseudomonadales bacterium]
MAGPLSGIRVLEFSQVIAAPFAGQVLTDLGAEVLKVEPPEGESWRLQASFAEKESKAYQCLNRGKRCLTLHMSRPESREIVHRLIPDFDAVLINYRPDAAARFGIDYPTLSKIKPDLVYVDLTAFGRHGQWADRPGYDGAVQAVSGLMAAEGKTREDESPGTISFTAIADYGSGCVLADALISGLYHRERTGEGQMIECSLLATALNLQPEVVMEHPVADSERNLRRATRRKRASEGAPYSELLSIRAPHDPSDFHHRVYLTADGAIVVAAETADEIASVRKVFALGESISQQDIGRLEAELELRTADSVLQCLFDAGIPASPVNLTEEMSIHPQVRDNGWMFDLNHPATGAQRAIRNPLCFSASPAEPAGPSPMLGQDTTLVLSRLGYSASEIDALRAQGVI